MKISDYDLIAENYEISQALIENRDSDLDYKILKGKDMVVNFKIRYDGNFRSINSFTPVILADNQRVLTGFVIEKHEYNYSGKYNNKYVWLMTMLDDHHANINEIIDTYNKTIEDRELLTLILTYFIVKSIIDESDEINLMSRFGKPVVFKHDDLIVNVTLPIEAQLRFVQKARLFDKRHLDLITKLIANKIKYNIDFDPILSEAIELKTFKNWYNSFKAQNLANLPKEMLIDYGNVVDEIIDTYSNLVSIKSSEFIQIYKHTSFIHVEVDEEKVFSEEKRYIESYMREIIIEPLRIIETINDMIKNTITKTIIFLGITTELKTNFDLNTSVVKQITHDIETIRKLNRI